MYGYRIASEDDPFLQLADECVDLLANRIASGGGIWPVDIVPARTSSSAFQILYRDQFCNYSKVFTSLGTRRGFLAERKDMEGENERDGG